MGAVGHTQLEHDHLAGDQVAGYQDVGHEDILWVHVHQEWYTSYLGNIYSFGYWRDCDWLSQDKQ